MTSSSAILPQAPDGNSPPEGEGQKPVEAAAAQMTDGDQWEKAQREIDALVAERERLTRELREAQARLANPSQAQAREVAFMAHERDALIKRRDHLASDLELEKKARAELVANLRREIDALAAERDTLTAAMEHERGELSQKITALTGERDQTLAERDGMAAQLAQAAEEQRRAGEILERERAHLAAQLAQAGEHQRQGIQAMQAQRDALAAERDQLAADLAQARDQHRAETAALARARETALDEREALAAQLAKAQQQHAQEQQALTDRQDIAVSEGQRVAAALAQLREGHAREIAELGQERTDLVQAREAIVAQLAAARGEHRRDFESFAAEREHFRDATALLSQQRDDIAAERDEMTAQLAALRESGRAAIERLARERDDARYARDEIAAQFAKAREESAAAFVQLTAERDELAKKHAHHLSTTSNLRGTHDEQVAALTAENAALTAARDGQVAKLTDECAALTAARDELRAHFDTLHTTHRHELERARREQDALASECKEARALLEHDRLAWQKQAELFSTERDTLAREREEAFAEVARERQTFGKQLELRAQECAGLAQQRTGALAQIEDLRGAQSRQGALFEEERKVLLQSGEETAAKLELALKALGMDRVTLLQGRLDAEAQLDAALASHQQALAERAQERDAVLQERDAALTALTPFQNALQREQAAFGTTTGGKHQIACATADDGLHMICHAHDAILDRDVEMKIFHDIETSPQQRRDLLDEARRLARLQHPNIPAIYDVGLSGAGQVFYTMEAVRGLSLREMLGQLEHASTGALLHFTLKRLLAIFHKVCDALAHAHAQGITHGSLRPESIVLGDFGEVFVTKWRLPRAAHGHVIEVQQDIAALGRLLYEITTLEPPDAAPASHPGAHAARRHPKPSPHWADDENVRSLLAVARHAIDEKAADKFHSVREFQTRVDVFKDSFHDPANLTLARLVAQWVRRYRIALIVIATLVLTLAVVLGTGAVRHLLDALPPTETSAPALPEEGPPAPR